MDDHGKLAHTTQQQVMGTEHAKSPTVGCYLVMLVSWKQSHIPYCAILIFAVDTIHEILCYQKYIRVYMFGNIVT